MKNIIFATLLMLSMNLMAQTPQICVIGAPSNGYEASVSILNGFTSFNNNENGYQASSNTLSGFFAFNNTTYGFNAISNSLNGYNSIGNGVNGYNADNNTFNGFSSVNNAQYGFIAEGNGSDGIYSHNNAGFAGYFSGNLHVTGTLSKSMGSFKIDHPLDPENKYLIHSFVESPDMMNVYNGNVMLDANGTASVELPHYFEALNMEYRYQLTCIGGFAQVYISDEIQNNNFTIAGGSPNLKVSWQVTGVRQDPYAEQNRLEVEVEKPVEFKGQYLHPEVYNLGAERSHDHVKLNKSKKGIPRK